MNTFNALAKASTEQLAPPAARTASANTTGVDISAYEGLCLIVADSAAGTGTSPTLDAKLQECDTSGGTYTDVPNAAFTQVTGTASQQKLVLDIGPRKKFLRVAYTVGGTTPSFACNVDLIGMKKYA